MTPPINVVRFSMLNWFSQLVGKGINIKDARNRSVITDHAAATVETFMSEVSSIDEIKERLSPRMNVYIHREAMKAYQMKFEELLRADIEAAAQRHLSATLGPRVEALEKVIEHDDPMARLKKFLDTMRKEVRDDQKPFEMGKLRTIEYIEGWMRGEKQP